VSKIDSGTKINFFTIHLERFFQCLKASVLQINLQSCWLEFCSSLAM